MLLTRTYGYVRGVRGDSHSYRNRGAYKNFVENQIMRIDRLFNNGRKQNFALGRILLCRVYAKTANTNSYKIIGLFTRIPILASFTNFDLTKG